jgi:hypothetical protein
MFMQMLTILNLSLKDSGERSKGKRCLQVPPRKLQNPPCPQTSNHHYRISSHRKEAMLQLQIAISPQRDIPPDISDQIPPEVAYCQKKPLKLENLPLLS